MQGVLQQAKSRWVPVAWDDLPGFAQDDLHDAWNAWLRSCERPPARFAALCPEIRRLSIASDEEQRASAPEFHYDWISCRLRAIDIRMPLAIPSVTSAVPP